MIKIDTWDLECSGVSFKANSGFLLCANIKTLGGKAETFKRDNMRPDPLNDKKLVKQIYNRLLKSDIWITHNGRWFDIPYFESRLRKWNLPPLPNTPHFDTCELAFKKLRVKNSLEALAEYLECPYKKYKVSMDEWVRAYAGNPQSLAKIVKHCGMDVRMTEWVYKRLRPVGFKHPNLALISGCHTKCPVCNTRDSLQAKGWKYAQIKKAIRYQCARCGAWSYGPYRKTQNTIRGGA